MRKRAAQTDPAGLEDCEKLLAERREPLSILEAIQDVDRWLHITKGFQAKLKQPERSHQAVLFWYGCGVGPAPAARALTDEENKKPLFDRFPLMRLNHYHVSEYMLDDMTRRIISAYNLCEIVRLWGSGQHASADGTKWDLHAQNLVSEYHRRYGGNGGIGYYHVSDNYIALFSHFFSYGTREGVYLLDALEENSTDIHLDTLHADTHGQSEAIFGLAFQLGI